MWIRRKSDKGRPVMASHQCSGPAACKLQAHKARIRHNSVSVIIASRKVTKSWVFTYSIYVEVISDPVRWSCSCKIVSIAAHGYESRCCIIQKDLFYYRLGPLTILSFIFTLNVAIYPVHFGNKYVCLRVCIYVYFWCDPFFMGYHLRLVTWNPGIGSYHLAWHLHVVD
jgi:hypothetical protein